MTAWVEGWGLGGKSGGLPRKSCALARNDSISNRTSVNNNLSIHVLREDIVQLPEGFKIIPNKPAGLRVGHPDKIVDIHADTLLLHNHPAFSLLGYVR